MDDGAPAGRGLAGDAALVLPRGSQRGHPGGLRADRGRALRAGALRRVPGHRGPDPELLDHLRLLHVLAGAGPAQRAVRGRVPGVQPVARDRPDDLGRLPPGRGAVRARAVHVSGAARPLAGRARRPAVRLAGADRRRRGLARARTTSAIATAIYTAITFVCMALFGVEEWIERGETFNAYFGMFARLGPVRDPRRRGRTPQVPDRRSPVGRDPRSGRAGAHLDRGDELRRRPGGRPLGRDPVDVRALQRHRLQPAELLPDREQHLAADHAGRRLRPLLARCHGYAHGAELATRQGARAARSPTP